MIICTYINHTGHPSQRLPLCTSHGRDAPTMSRAATISRSERAEPNA